MRGVTEGQECIVHISTIKNWFEVGRAVTEPSLFMIKEETISITSGDAIATRQLGCKGNH